MDGDASKPSNSYLFDYNFSEACWHKQKCCKRYKKKGKTNCEDCPKLRP